MDWSSSGNVRYNASRFELKSKSPVAVKWVSSCDDIETALWNACFPVPLEGKWWYWCLEKSGLDAQFSFAYAIIYMNQEPVGIAPAFLMDVPIDLVAPELIAKILIAGGALVPSMRYQRTLFVGSVCADEGTVGLVPGVSLFEVAEALQDAFDEKARELKAAIVVWKDFPDTAGKALDALAAQKDLGRVVSYPGTIVELPDGGYEKYVANLKSSHRHNYLKKLKKSKKLGALDVSVVQNPSADTLVEIMGLFWQTYERGKTKFERLNLEFFKNISRQEPSWFVLLRNPQDGKLCAFMLCFKLGTRVINKFIGLDYSYPGDWYLYFRLWEAAVEWACGQGACEFQSGQTGYRAKIDVGSKLVPLTNYFKRRNKIIHFVFKKIAATMTWSDLDSDLETFVKAHPDQDQTKGNPEKLP